MECELWCILAYILVGIFLSFQIVKRRSRMFKDFQNSLNEEQLRIYLKIVNERSRIFTSGILLGLLVSSIIAYYYYKHTNTGIRQIVCIFIGVTLAVSIVYYMLHPKKVYILPYLTTFKQRFLWLDIYKTFKKYKYYGVIVGIILYRLSNFKLEKIF